MSVTRILLIVLTSTMSFAIFELVRRCAPLRALFGLATTAATAVKGQAQLAPA